MELTEKEKMLINAVREIGEAPGNILLWYAAGLEGAMTDPEDRRGDQRRIDIANAWAHRI